MDKHQADQVLLLLRTEETSLRALAQLVHQHPFDFYQGADLTGLNLNGQDLRGMNFAAADLRFTSLEGVEYDEGAFNGSYLLEAQRQLQDPFHFYAADLLRHNNQEILIHCRFRPRALDRAIAELMLSVTLFASNAGISANALRKARAGQVVAIETAQRIIKALKERLPDVSSIFEAAAVERILKQPSIEFLSGGINNPFKHISRSRYRELIELRDEIKMLRRLMMPAGSQAEWRNTAESIEWTIRYYRERAAEIDDAESSLRNI